MLGARDLAFPRLNLASWYLFMAGGLIALIGLAAGGVDTGWTFYTPLSTDYAKGYVVLVCCGIILSGYSSIATGLNFMITIHKLRPPGMDWYRLPLFLWSLYSVSVLYVLATPVLAMAMVLILFERIFHVGVFDPALGGDPLLFQHLFWFYSHPAVYIMILPGFGVVSEIITAFARKPIFGYKFIAWSSVSIAVISFFVWGHHMFVAGTSLYSSIVFSLLSFMVVRAIGDQGLQLARDAAQRLYPVQRADALHARVHRAVHHRRIDGVVRGVSRRRCSPARYLFRRCAFPLHHGGRHGVRVLRRAALLVAQNHRANVSARSAARSPR